MSPPGHRGPSRGPFSDRGDYRNTLYDGIPVKRLVLAGAGHAHVQVLKDWIATSLRDMELLLILPSALAPCPDMVPHWLAGHYRNDDICVDFTALAAAAQARLLIDELVALKPDRQRLQLRSHLVLEYDLLPLNVEAILCPSLPRTGRACWRCGRWQTCAKRAKRCWQRPRTQTPSR